MEGELNTINYWINHFKNRVDNYKPESLGFSIEFFKSELSYWESRKAKFSNSEK